MEVLVRSLLEIFLISNKFFGFVRNWYFRELNWFLERFVVKLKVLGIFLIE